MQNHEVYLLYACCAIGGHPDFDIVIRQQTRHASAVAATQCDHIDFPRVRRVDGTIDII